MGRPGAVGAEAASRPQLTHRPNRVHPPCVAPQARHRKEAETRRFIDEFVAAREAHKAERMDEIARENDEIRAYADKVMVRETELRMAREREQNAKDAILEQLSAEMSARQVRRRSLLWWCGAIRAERCHVAEGALRRAAVWPCVARRAFEACRCRAVIP